MYRKQNQMIEIAICLADAAALLISLFAACMLRYENIPRIMKAENMQLLCSVLFMLHIAVFYFLKPYE